MTPRPVALGLFICDDVIVERGTGKVSPIGIFDGIAVERFPQVPPPFSVFAALTDGQGEGIIRLVVSSLASNEDIYTHEGPYRFPSRLTEVNYHLRIRHCEFPVAGWYLFTLMVDGEMVAQRRIQLFQGRDKK